MGHADLDRQHRQVAHQAAALHVSLVHRDDAPDIELLAHEIVDGLAAHLRDEAAPMRRLGVARAEDAVRADVDRLAAIQRDFAEYHVGSLELAALVERITHDLVAGHLTGAPPPLPSLHMALMQLRAPG